MISDKNIKTLGYCALAILVIYFFFGLLKISGEGLLDITKKYLPVKEGYRDDDKNEKKLDRISEKLQEKLEIWDEDSERQDDKLAELEDIEGLGEYSDHIEHYKNKYEVSIRNKIKDGIISGRGLESQASAIIKEMTLLQALDMASAGGASGAASKIKSKMPW